MKHCMTLVLMLAGLAGADGFIVPVDDTLRVRGPWAVNYHHVDIRVRDQVASVAVDQEFVNTSGRQMLEVEYFFPVPPDTAVDSMTLVVNGREFRAKLLDADEARRIYETIVRRKKDPALLEYAGQGLYKTRAFPLQPNQPARVQVTYKTICRRDGSAVEVWYPMATEKFSSRPIGEVTVDIDIRTDQPIRSVYCPSVTMDVRRPSPAHVIARWSERDILPTRDLSLFYECSADAVGGTLLSHVAEEGQGGYALVLVSPDPTLTQADSPPKDVVIVFDHSGSMAGEKMRQTRRAVNHILNHLAPEDRFNVVPYCDIVEPLYDGLVPADRSSIEQATAAVDRIEARGGTAIDDALAAAFDCFIPPRYRTGVPGEDRSAYVLFITDGRPTVGETDIQKILRRATRDNNSGARVLAFGVGYDVNVRLLDLLADQNRGRSLYVKPNEPIDAKVTSLYEKIRRPVMTDLSVAVEGVRLRDGYPRRVGDLYAGDQIVIAARYDADRAADLPGRGDRRLATLVVRGRLQGRTRRFEYPVSLEVRPQRGPLGRDFVEKLWATRRVGYLMDQIQLHGRSDEVVEEIVRLSKQYGIMTPYTSFLADETTALSRRDEVMGKAGANMERLRSSEIGDVAQRDAAMRQQLNDSSAPAEMAFRKADQPAGATPMVGNTTRQAYEADREEKVAGVRQVGNQALYRRGQVMIAANAADLDPRRDRAKVQVVQRYSRDYFELVRANTAAENQVLASQRDDEQLLIRLRGQAYLIE